MSTAAAAAPAEAAPPAAKKGGAMKMIVAVLVAAGVAGGGAFFVASKKAAAKPAGEAGAESAEHASAEEAHGGGHEEAHGESHDGAPKAGGGDYFALQPAFVVNLNDDEAMRFLQIELEVAAPKTATQEAVKLATPLIRNRLMLLFSSQRYHELLAREGKEKLQQQALDEINKVLDEQKKPHVSNVVFTSFVMQ